MLLTVARFSSRHTLQQVAVNATTVDVGSRGRSVAQIRRSVCWSSAEVTRHFPRLTG